MTPYDIGQVILCCATAGMLGLTVYVLKKHWHAPGAITTDTGVLRLLMWTGPQTMENLRRSGVTDPEERIERLIFLEYVKSDSLEAGALLYGITPLGGSYIRRLDAAKGAGQ